MSSPTPGHFSLTTTRGSCRTANWAAGTLRAPHRSRYRRLSIRLRYLHRIYVSGSVPGICESRRLCRTLFLVWHCRMFPDCAPRPGGAELHLDRRCDAGAEGRQRAAGVIGPDGKWLRQCPDTPEPSLVTAVLDRDDPDYDIPLQRARAMAAEGAAG